MPVSDANWHFSWDHLLILTIKSRPNLKARARLANLNSRLLLIAGCYILIAACLTKLALP